MRLPGLHDHHVHLRALAAAAASVRAGPPPTSSGAELAARLRAADAHLPAGVGCAPSAITSWWPGRLTPCPRPAPPPAPVRVQHLPGRSGWSTRSRRPAWPGRVRAQRGGTRQRRPPDRAALADGPLARRPGARRDADLGSGPRRGEQGGSARNLGFNHATPGATDDDLAFLEGAPIAQRLCCMAPPEASPPPKRWVAPVKSCSTTPRCRRLRNSPD